MVNFELYDKMWKGTESEIENIRNELKKSDTDVDIIVSQFKKLFERLASEPTALLCVKIDFFCSDLHFSKLYNKFPSDFQLLIDDCMSLHDWPSKYCDYSPKDLLKRTEDFISKMQNQK